MLAGIDDLLFNMGAHHRVILVTTDRFSVSFLTVELFFFFTTAAAAYLNLSSGWLQGG